MKWSLGLTPRRAVPLTKEQNDWVKPKPPQAEYGRVWRPETADTLQRCENVQEIRCWFGGGHSGRSYKHQIGRPTFLEYSRTTHGRRDPHSLVGGRGPQPYGVLCIDSDAEGLQEDRILVVRLRRPNATKTKTHLSYDGYASLGRVAVSGGLYRRARWPGPDASALMNHSLILKSGWRGYFWLYSLSNV